VCVGGGGIVPYVKASEALRGWLRHQLLQHLPPHPATGAVVVHGEWALQADAYFFRLRIN
jgi:hypothetical protein